MRASPGAPRAGIAISAALALGWGCDGKTLVAFPEHFVGVGVELTMKGGPPVVVRVIAGGPAEEMGIAAGDRIVAIDGEPVERMTLAQVVDRLRGPPGSEVTLQLVSAGGGATRVVLTRRAVSLKQTSKR